MVSPVPDDLPQQLSLFDGVAPLPPANPAGATATAATQAGPGQPAADALQRQPMPAPPPPVPAAPVRALVPHFQHPRAQRSIQLGEHQVSYAFRRARRRSIGFSVGADGLAVSAPRWVALSEVDQALQAKAGWILRKLHEQHERARRVQANRIDWRDGTALPFLGETLVVVLDARITGAQLGEPTPALPGVAQRLLHIGLPHSATQEQIREAVQSWLQRQARRVFEERCAHFAQQLGVRLRRLSLSSAATRWGSASADGSVRLHWRLVHFAMPVIDYVVAHELAHLREMNHSPAFWDVVRSVLPDFERHRGALKAELLPSFD
jgi:predicted metal-dependent hydrolase